MSTNISSQGPSRLREGRDGHRRKALVGERGGLGGAPSARITRDSPSGEYLNNHILTTRNLRFLALAQDENPRLRNKPEPDSREATNAYRTLFSH